MTATPRADLHRARQACNVYQALRGQEATNFPASESRDPRPTAGREAGFERVPEKVEILDLTRVKNFSKVVRVPYRGRKTISVLCSVVEV